MPRGLGLAPGPGIHEWFTLNGRSTVRVPQGKLTLRAFSGLETEIAEIPLDTTQKAQAEARVPLSGETFWALGRAHLLPIVSVNGLPNAATAFDVGTGLAFRRGRVVLDFMYMLERCAFPWQGNTRRSEQLGTLTLGGGVELRLR